VQGSIAEIINITYGNSTTDAVITSTTEHSLNQTASFVCKYMTVGDNNSLQSVDSSSGSFQRGVALSEYKHCYDEYLQSSSSNFQILSRNCALDPYDRAIKQLHMSVIPERLTGREAERERIEAAITNGIKSHGSTKPLYISGMPGNN
jgi:hypothetical protein